MKSKYEILCGDSFLKLEDIATSSVDSIITDPPYGINILGSWWDKEVPNRQLWEKCYRVIKPNAYMLCFAAPRLYHKVASEIEAAGFTIVDQLIWIYSTGIVKNISRLKNAHEPIVVAIKKDANFDKVLMNIDSCRVPWDKAPPKVPKGGISRLKYGAKTSSTSVELKDSNPLGRHPSNVLGDIEQPYSKYFYAPRATRAEKGSFNDHPTVKPVSLMTYLIKLITPENGLVLDPFNGSGTTGVAAISSGYNYIGIDIEQKYCDISERRIKSVVSNNVLE